MPAETRSPATRRLSGALVIVAIVTLVAACRAVGVPPASPAPPAPTPPAQAPLTPVPGPSDGVLVSYLAHGGHCRTGTCEFTAEIFRDGRVTRSDDMVQVVDPMSLELLVRGVEDADWDAILGVPFVGECPVNFDGQEQVYTFHVPPEPVVVASCTTLIDPTQEPFRAVNGILFGTGG